MSITGLSAAGGPSQAADEVFSFSQPTSLEQAGRSLLSTFIHNRLHDSVQTSQCIRLDPLYLSILGAAHFSLPAKRTKQPTPFTVLSRGAQPSILAGRRPACPAFQQPMRPATSSFLSIANLARVRSKSPKDMSHAARLALQPQRLQFAAPAAQVALGSSQAEQPKQWSLATTPHRPMPSRLLALASRRAAPPRRLPRDNTIQEEDKEKLNFSYIGAARRRRRKQRKMVLCTGKM